MKKFLYLLTPIKGSIRNRWEDYDSAIVCAHNEEQAKRMHPGNLMRPDFFTWDEEKESWAEDGKIIKPDDYNTWSDHINQIKTDLVGEAIDSVEIGILITSHNAA